MKMILAALLSAVIGITVMWWVWTGIFYLMELI
jgi:hypothetical protein